MGVSTLSSKARRIFSMVERTVSMWCEREDDDDDDDDEDDVGAAAAASTL